MREEEDGEHFLVNQAFGSRGVWRSIKDASFELGPIAEARQRFPETPIFSTSTSITQELFSFKF